jgi:outer membrane immunogenic protein
MSTCKVIKLGFAAAMLLSASAVSEAADAQRGPAYRPPPPPPIPYFSWTGFYAGAHVGVGWSDGDGGSSSSTFLGGGQVGYNYQINQWVLGLEADISGTTQNSGSATAGGLSASGTGFGWVSTLAPRFGYAVDRWLVYGKFGGAWAHATGTANIAVNGVVVNTISVNSNVSGWVLGIGTEYALRDNWTAKFEYNMMDFGSDGPFADTKFHVFKAGLNYRFGGPGGLF